MFNLQYGFVQPNMFSRDDGNMNTIIKQRVIDEEEAESDISEEYYANGMYISIEKEVDEYDAIIIKDTKIKLLEEEVSQVPKKTGRVLSFQEICGIARTGNWSKKWWKHEWESRRRNWKCYKKLMEKAFVCLKRLAHGLWCSYARTHPVAEE